MGEQRDHRREDAERDVARDVGTAQTEHGRRHETGETDEDRSEKSLSHDAGSIMSPSPFVVAWVTRVARELGAERERRRALDVAMGRGRHAVVIAGAGFHTFGVDMKLDAVVSASAAARHAGAAIHAWCADLTQHPLPPTWFDLVVITRYLQRDLFEALRRTVRPGGFVLYETFTVAQRTLNRGPRSAGHLLEPGELRARFDVAGWTTVFYEETREPEALARITTRRSG
jgi:SAM-dependent methyltransferase